MKIQPIRLGVASVLTAGLIVLGGGAAMPKANAAEANPTDTTYKIIDNDTMSKIAQQYGIDLNSLLSANPALGNGNQIFPGNLLNIPLGSLFGGFQGNDGTGNGGFPNGGLWGGGADNGSVPNGGATGGGTGNGSVPNGGTAGAGTNNGGAPSGGTTTGGGTVAQSEYAAQVVTLVNQERTKAGLSQLQTDDLLTKVATDKAKDMYDNNYFDHNSPTYGSPFDMMRAYGVNYSYAGENIAKGQRDPEEVMTAWMNSPGHKANILGANYNKIGVAYYNGEWVQEFTS